jgi:ATP-dependent RNA helicase DDX42
MNFVRGASSDTAEKGERYGWSRPVPAASRGRKRPHDDESDEDAYFDKDEEPQHSRVAAPTPEEDPLDAFMAELHGRNARTAPQTDDPAAPAATRPATAGAVKPWDAAPPPPLTADDLEEDPLDAFMAGLASAPSQPKGRERAVQQCDEEEDPVASYLEESGLRAAEAEAEAEAEVDGGSVRRQLKGQKGGGRSIGAELLPVDHAAIEYDAFERELYAPHPTIRELSAEQVRERRAVLRLSVSGFDVPSPIARFEHAGLPRELLATVRKLGYEEPTSVQMQALPVAMSGRDLIGVAATGSGKTVAYLLPLGCHVMAQRRLEHGEGPIGLVLAPTHELAEQIALECRKLLGRSLGLNCASLIGGVGKYEQLKALRAGCEVAVGTPGRLVELLAMKNGLCARRVTFVVLDEADRMFSLGFEPQV